MINHQPTPRCLAWIEGVGQCEKTTGAQNAPHCPQHQTAGWSFCEHRRCGLWAIVYTGLEWRCGWHEGEHYLGGSRLAAEQGIEAAEALANWLRAAVESKPSTVDLTPRDAHRAYVARYGCPWAKGTCEPCREEAAKDDLYDPERDFDLANNRAMDYYLEAARLTRERRWSLAERYLCLLKARIKWTRCCVRSEDHRARLRTTGELYGAAVRALRQAKETAR